MSGNSVIVIGSLLAAASGSGFAHADTAAAIATEIAPVVVEAKRSQALALSVLPGSIQDTPQAVTVITGEQLKAQGVSGLEQALRNVPGITIAIGEGGTLNGDQFKIRGFDAKDDIYVDGLRDFGVYTRDSFAYQEVQVLKGPSGALFGRGSVGGAINTVSKAPKLREAGEVDAYSGSGNYYRLLGDYNAPLGPTMAVRLNLMATSAGVVDRDHIFSKRYGFSGVLGTGIGTDTTFTLGFLHQDDRRRPDYGVTIVQRPGALRALPATEYGLPRSTYLSYETDADHTRADIITARFLKVVSPNLTLTSDTRLGTYSRYFQYTTVDTCNVACTTAFFDGNPATVPLANYGGSSPYKQRAWGAQNITTARLDAPVLGLRNAVIAGFDLSYQSNKKHFYVYGLPAGYATRNTIPQPLTAPNYYPPVGYYVFSATAANLHCPAVGTVNCTTTNPAGATVFSNLAAAGVLYSDGDATDGGVFLTDHLWLTRSLSVLASVREDRYVANYTSTAATFATTGIKSTSNLFNPRLSVIWEPSDAQTWYVTWGRAATPQGTSIVGAATAIAVTARDLQPEISATLEAGAKVALMDGKLSATASVFRIDKSNAVQTDPSTGFIAANSGDKQRVEGFELGLLGKVTRAWTLTAGYTWLDARIVYDLSCSTATSLVAAVCKPNPYVIGQTVEFTPRNAASVWTTYDLAALVPGLTIGGGVTYQGPMNVRYTSAGTAPNVTGLSRIAAVPKALSFDGVVTWAFGRWKVGVNGYNLGDRLNYTQVFGNRAVPAAGRTVIASLSVTF